MVLNPGRGGLLARALWSDVVDPVLRPVPKHAIIFRTGFWEGSRVMSRISLCLCAAIASGNDTIKAGSSIASIGAGTVSSLQSAKRPLVGCQGTEGINTSRVGARTRGFSRPVQALHVAVGHAAGRRLDPALQALLVNEALDAGYRIH